jgi:hypothetical protein
VALELASTPLVLHRRPCLHALRDRRSPGQARCSIRTASMIDRNTASHTSTTLAGASSCVLSHVRRPSPATGKDRQLACIGRFGGRQGSEQAAAVARQLPAQREKNGMQQQLDPPQPVRRDAAAVVRLSCAQLSGPLSGDRLLLASRRRVWGLAVGRTHADRQSRKLAITECPWVLPLVQQFERNPRPGCCLRSECEGSTSPGYSAELGDLTPR